MQRARLHLEDLNQSLKDYVEADPDGKFDAHLDPEDQHYIFRYHASPIPDTFGVVLGDVLHNARSALDHAVWQLVIASGRSPGRHNTFPIYFEQEDWERDVVVPRNSRRRSPLEGVAEPCVEFIEGRQPWCSRGVVPDVRRLPLGVLKRCSNTDKHQVLHAAVRSLSGAGASINVKPLLLAWSDDAEFVPVGTRLEDGIVVARAQLKTVPGVPDIDPQVSLVLPTAVHFDDPDEPGASIPMRMFSQVLVDVEGIIDELESL